jgi:Tfp pilus assembly protein PilX
MSTPVRRQALQRGATLVVTLIMLVMMTLFAIAAINLSGSNMKVVGNMQARTAAEAAAMWAIEDTLSGIAWFTGSAGAVRTVVAPNGLTAQVQGRACKAADPCPGCSAKQYGATIVPEDTVWEFKVEVTDPVTNAKAAMWQGTKIRMLAGNCL